jgi:hypothetical protein
MCGQGKISAVRRTALAARPVIGLERVVPGPVGPVAVVAPAHMRIACRPIVAARFDIAVGRNAEPEAEIEAGAAIMGPVVIMPGRPGAMPLPSIVRGTPVRATRTVRAVPVAGGRQRSSRILTMSCEALAAGAAGVFAGGGPAIAGTESMPARHRTVSPALSGEERSFFMCHSRG